MNLYSVDSSVCDGVYHTVLSQMNSFPPKNRITQITKIPDYSTTDESKHIIVHVKLSRSGSHELKHLRDEIIGFYAKRSGRIPEQTAKGSCYHP